MSAPSQPDTSSHTFTACESTQCQLRMRCSWNHVLLSSYQKHWTDVCYLEAVKRLLTNLQLSIRTVVADSNSQASKLHDEIARLRNAMEVCVCGRA